jgi:hypothetical protein
VSFWRKRQIADKVAKDMAEKPSETFGQISEGNDEA